MRVQGTPSRAAALKEQVVCIRIFQHKVLGFSKGSRKKSFFGPGQKEEGGGG